ncbi:MAG: hypothetical protein JSS34_08065 [Proteobacteria bacterium]|nr:hypothetical protein [Pseudomonadota bacterium]
MQKRFLEDGKVQEIHRWKNGISFWFQDLNKAKALRQRYFPFHKWILKMSKQGTLGGRDGSLKNESIIYEIVSPRLNRVPQQEDILNETVISQKLHSLQPLLIDLAEDLITQKISLTVINVGADAKQVWLSWPIEYDAYVKASLRRTLSSHSNKPKVLFYSEQKETIHGKREYKGILFP